MEKDEKKYKFDSDGKLLNKDKHVEDRIEELRLLYSVLPDEQLERCDSIIQEMAFQEITLVELKSIIGIKGYSERYQNGANQFGTKDTVEKKDYKDISKLLLNHRQFMENLVQRHGASTEVSKDDFDEFVSSRDA